MTHDKTVEAVARAMLAHEWGNALPTLDALDTEYRQSSSYWNGAAIEVVKTLTALDWLPPEAQANIERAALQRAAEVCMSEAPDWETRQGNPCKRLTATILALIPATKEQKS